MERIQKSNCFRKGIQQALRIVTVSFLTVTPSPKLLTDLWPPVMSLPPSFQVLPESKLSMKTLIQ